MTNPFPPPSPILIELVNKDSGSFDWITTVLPFVTLALGAFLTYFFTGRADRRKETRADELRWHADVRRLSSSAVTAARAIHQASVEKTNLLNVPDAADQPAADDLYSKAHSNGWAEHAVLLALQGDMSLVAPASISVALLELIEASHTLLTSTDDQLEESRSALRPKITAFVESTRKYLGVKDDVKK